MIQEAIAKVMKKKNLSLEEAEEVMDEINDREVNQLRLALLLVGLRKKGETAEEIAGFARSMRNHAVKIAVKRSPLIDTCGTGGDKTGTFNISTAVAFVAAGADVAVAKHGNRSASSKCGSADVLEALGAHIELSPEAVSRCIDEIGFGFLYAPNFYPAMKYVAELRKKMKVKTIFNILGPLVNPASASIQLIGVYSDALTEIIAEALKILGASAVLIVHGPDGLDELSLAGPNKITELSNEKIRTFYLDPQSLGLPRASIMEIKGGTAEENADIIKSVLKGGKSFRRDTVLLNAAAVLTIAGRAKDFEEGLVVAAQSIDSGQARKKLEQYIQLSQGLK